jgi:hypothetical protein
MARKQQLSVRTMAQTKMHRQGRHSGQMQGLMAQAALQQGLLNPPHPQAGQQMMHLLLG